MLFVTAQQDDIYISFGICSCCVIIGLRYHRLSNLNGWSKKEKVIFLSDPNQRHASIQWIFKSAAYALMIHTKDVLAFRRSWGIKLLSSSSCELSKWIQFWKSHLPLTIERFEMVTEVWKALSSGKFWLLLQWECPKYGLGLFWDHHLNFQCNGPRLNVQCPALRSLLELHVIYNI